MGNNHLTWVTSRSQGSEDIIGTNVKLQKISLDKKRRDTVAKEGKQKNDK